MPQESRTKVDQLQEIYNIIDAETKTAREKGQSIMIIGDMNCKIGKVIPGNKEDITKGGRLLLKLMKNHNLNVVNAMECCEGLWTRIENGIKSVIDYAIMFEEDLRMVNSMEIDEEKYRTPYHLENTAGIRERKYSDHCMITLQLNILVQTEAKQTRVNVLNKDGLTKFKNILSQKKVSNIIDDKDIRSTYTVWNKEIVDIRDSCYKSVKIRKTWKVSRKLTAAKKEITKDLKTKNLTSEQVKLLKERRRMLIELIEEEEQAKEYARITKIVDDIKRDGGVNGTTFWEVRKKLCKPKKEAGHAMMDANGVRCEKPEEIKNIYKEWYKELLTLNKGITEEEKEVEQLVEMQWEVMEAISESKESRTTTIGEVQDVIKKLKINKAKDASSWKNKMIVQGGDEMAESLKKIFNQIDSQRKIPNEWHLMEILAIHKKGKKELMKNKRGLFLTNNISKIYERVLKNRNEDQFNNGITKWNTGGIKNRSTIDNILITTSMIEQNQYLKRNTYLTFTDAEKCFDKMWLLDGVGELWRCGTDVRDCVMIKKLNETAHVTVKTPVGNTDSVHLQNIVRQGTVYGPQICIATMDNINIIGKQIKTPYTPETDISATTFIDDITGTGGYETANNTLFNCNMMEDRKKMLFNNTDGKTEYMVVIGNREEEIKTVTNEVRKGKISRVEEHKMLGCWFDKTGRFEPNIIKRKEKLPIMLQTIRNQASPKTVGIKAVAGRLQLIEAVVIQSMLNSAEGFHDHNDTEIKHLESLQLHILTTILELPPSTPYYALLIETGWWTMKARIHYRKMMLYHNIINSDENRVVKKLVKIQQKVCRDTTWYASVKKAIEHYGVMLNPTKALKSVWKKHVKERINKKLSEELHNECASKTKSRTVRKDEYKMKDYIGKLSVDDTKKVIRARLHMTRIPGNYKQLEIKKCPLCESSETNTEHYFNCKRGERLAKVWGVSVDDLTSDNILKLKNVGDFLETIEVLLEPFMKTRMEKGKAKTTTCNTLLQQEQTTTTSSTK